jgi:hypothetical protein
VFRALPVRRTVVGACPGKTDGGCAVPGCVLCVKGAFGVRCADRTSSTLDPHHHDQGRTQLSRSSSPEWSQLAEWSRRTDRGPDWLPEPIVDPGRPGSQWGNFQPASDEKYPRCPAARASALPRSGGCPAYDRIRPHPGIPDWIAGAGTGNGDLGHLVRCPRSPPGVQAFLDPPRACQHPDETDHPPGHHRFRSSSRGFRLAPEPISSRDPRLDEQATRFGR